MPKYGFGPVRPASQVEISLTDSFRLGVRPPVKESGELQATPGLTLIGPAGELQLDSGTIVALRHIHMTPADAQRMGLRDRDMVAVETTGIRRGVLGNVLVRIADAFTLELHVDIDEANAFAMKNGDEVILKKQ